jgi:hypothetical protein
MGCVLRVIVCEGLDMCWLRECGKALKCLYKAKPIVPPQPATRNPEHTPRTSLAIQHLFFGVICFTAGFFNQYFGTSRALFLFGSVDI